MIYNFIVLIVASFVAGCITAYALWVWIRGTLLRQDLFLIRDSLWDDAHKFGCFDDPAYKQARERLHLMIRGGPYLSLPLMAVVMKSSHSPSPKRPPSMNAQMEDAIRKAERQTADRVWRYVRRDRFASYLSWYLYVGGRRMIKQLFKQWMESDAPAALARYSERGVAA